jgi:hypothetical protein
MEVMKMRKMKLMFGLAVAIAVVFAAFGFAQASTYTFVGSWVPDDGPWWTNNPLAYSGVGAAELLFGPGTYAISTVDSDPAHINFEAWYNIIGIGPAVFPQNYFRGTEGVTHYQDVYVFDPNIDTVSAYVADFDTAGTNYAFVQRAVPEPSTMLLLGSGLIGLAGLGRRKFFRK